MKWIKKTLGTIYDLEKGSVQTGPFGSQLHESDYKEFGVPVIMPKDIVNDRLNTSSIARISEEDAKRLKKHLVILNDIVYPRRGDIGKRIIIDEKNIGAFCGTGCIKLRGSGEILNPKFLFFYLKQKTIIKWIENQAIGATMMNLNTSILRSLPICFPNLPTQKKIANILSAYDDLIENNNQRIQLLEEMAAEIYKEWFVRFRFPGYESASFVDKEGKEVPQGTDRALPLGWEKVKIDDGFKILGGGTPSTIQLEYWEEGNINWYSPTDITRSGSVFMHNSAKQITEKGLASSSAKLFPKKSVMMTSRATIGAVGINLTEACTNQGFITCLPNNDFPYTYIYEWIKGNKKLIESFSSGATFKEISRGVFKTFKIIRPDRATMSEYHELVEPIFDELNLLQQKNKTLQETRDLLLPRLISGKLSVETLVNS
jgi:type I restriction enzyme S subunit